MKNEIIKYFEYENLPKNLKEISKSIYKLAHEMDLALPPSAEKSAGLRKLLEAKDCFVRAMI